MYDVMTLGSATVDMFARSQSQLIKIFDERGETDLLAFRTGSKILMEELTYEIGGGGTNTAAAFANLGLKTAYIGKIGNGYNSQRILSELERYNITPLVKQAKGPSPLSIILDNEQKDRVILTHKGICKNLKPRDIPPLDTRWLYSSSLTGESLKTLQKLFKKAKKQGIKTAFNPSSYLTKQDLSVILKNTDVLILNREEAYDLTATNDMEQSLALLRKLGPQITVITDGKDKAQAMDDNYIYTAPSKKVRPVDTTGAGDAFAASVIYGLIKKDLSYGLSLGVENSASVIKHIGAKKGLIKRKLIKTKVRRKKYE